MKEICSLKVDFATYEATKYSCLNWHYSKSVPCGKLVKIGVWEDGKFIGVVLFGRGANKCLVNPYGLKQDQGCELVRVALTKHKHQVSQIMMKAIKMLKQTNPNLKLIVSYADSGEGHHGGIYQATNWIYDGHTKGQTDYYLNGKKIHARTISSKGGVKAIPNLVMEPSPPKHRYLFPLDKKLKKQLMKIAKPYPKRGQINEI